jgi:hypothetical protein
LELLLAFWEYVHEGDDAAADVDVHAPVGERSTSVSSIQALPVEDDGFLDVAIERAGGELVLIKAKLPEAWSSAESVQGSQSIQLQLSSKLFVEVKNALENNMLLPGTVGSGFW